MNLTTCHTLRLDTSNPCSIVIDEKNKDPSVVEMKKFWRALKKFWRAFVCYQTKHLYMMSSVIRFTSVITAMYEVSLPWK